ncbi:MAG: TIGR03915 family putative DNA repair protein [Halanaerobiales bacterium]
MEMNYLIYDGSFPGLLTAIYQAFKARIKIAGIILEEEYQAGLFSNKIIVETELDKSDKVYEAVKDKISPKSLRKIYRVYLSETENSGLLIYQYLQLGFRMGKKIDSYLHNDIVDRVNKIDRKVSKEAHLLLGLLRFRKIQGGVFYAPFEPDYNIITLLAPHFVRRLPDQDWIIHDRKRMLAAIYNREEWVLTELDSLPEPKITEEEKYYQALWQSFYKNVAIESRKNPRLQAQFMPRRYWDYLIEKTLPEEG